MLISFRCEKNGDDGVVFFRVSGVDRELTAEWYAQGKAIAFPVIPGTESKDIINARKEILDHIKQIYS